MPIRRTRMIGGERYIKKHHGHITGISDIRKKLAKIEKKSEEKKRKSKKEGRKEVKGIRQGKNKLLKQATELYKKGMNATLECKYNVLQVLNLW